MQDKITSELSTANRPIINDLLADGIVAVSRVAVNVACRQYHMPKL